MRKPIPYLDGWRGLAILLVLFSHFVRPGNGWAGAMGVSIFFVLSGYLMSDLLFLKQVSLKDFFVRRFNRIVPLCWLFVACMTTYAMVWQQPTYDVSFAELVATLTFLRTYLPLGMDVWSEQWSIGHLWSLNVEEHSYAFLAIGAFICARFAWKRNAAVWFLVGTTAAVLTFNVAYSIAPPSGASLWVLRSECASLGLMAAALFLVFRRTVAPPWVDRVPPAMLILTLVIALACFKTYGHKDASRVIAPLALAFTVVWLDRSPRWMKTLLSTSVLRWFGRCSFSLYLWQEPFYLLLQDKKISALAAAWLSVAVGALSFYLIEDRSRIWLNERWARRRAGLRGGSRGIGAPNANDVAGSSRYKISAPSTARDDLPLPS